MVGGGSEGVGRGRKGMNVWKYPLDPTVAPPIGPIGCPEAQDTSLILKSQVRGSKVTDGGVVKCSEA